MTSIKILNRVNTPKKFTVHIYEHCTVSVKCNFVTDIYCLGGYAKFTGLKTYNKNLKTMLAIGGWNEGSSRFSNLVADEDRRATFVKNVVKFLRQNNFDGLDLDWEYPAFRDGSKPADKENYAALVKVSKTKESKYETSLNICIIILTM